MSDYLVDEITVGAVVVKIYPDTNSSDPRKDFEHAATFALTHRRYDLANESGIDLRDFNTLGEAVDAIRENGDDVVAWLPVYGYEHGALTLSAGQPFSCPWDSGIAGLAYITREAMNEGWGAGEWTEENALDCIRAEVTEYDQYLTGEVYGFVVEDRDGEQVDGLWGVYGSDYVREEALCMAQHWSAVVIAEAEAAAYALAEALEVPDVATALAAHQALASV